MERKSIADINQYCGSTINPLDTPDTIYELYSVPSYENQVPEIIKGKEIGSSKITVEDGDVLICKINPRINRVWVVKRHTPYQLLASSEWIVIRNHELDSDYLKWYFSSPFFRELMTSQVAGIGGSLTRAQPKQVAKYPVPIVKVGEQRKIAAVLDKVSDLIAKRRQQIDKLDELVKAKFMEITDVAVTNSVRMGDVATYINGYAFKPIDWSTEGLPIIRIQNLNNKDAVYNYYKGELPKKYRVYHGDVLISWATHLEAYIWKGQDAWLNQHIFRAEFNKIPLNHIYFVYSTEQALQQAFRNAHGFKPTMEHIKRSDFENAIIELPSLERQNQFAAFVEQTEKTKTTISESLEKLETLKKALMQEYFG